MKLSMLIDRIKSSFMKRFNGCENSSIMKFIHRQITLLMRQVTALILFLGQQSSCHFSALGARNIDPMHDVSNTILLKIIF
ncbi:hypothetical protein A359_00130 [secondary endosymbiont of Ctenarytaina eucalypti]|uniref:Uncharacterized protein n=1 Tax=secondary endosymbiont of Ctenarytaina eucalypti TaxID=1199245 RepID=J3TEV5_9ENTR|nr:hypothetical protein A359_00130 [secondary endosymbiont of Ctenarytaina eucalypti]